MGLYIGNSRWKVVDGDSYISFVPFLPYDAEVEYLATDGMAYIDTGVKPSNTVRFEIVMDVPVPTTSIWLFGGRTSSSAGQLALLYNISSNQWSWRFGNQRVINNTSISTGRYTFDNHTSGAPRQLYIKHNDTTLTLTATNNTFTCDNNIFLFALNIGTAANKHADEKLVSAKFWSGSTLVRDYIPVRKDGVGYLYDQVGGTLYGNAEDTGAFTYGNDVKLLK